MFHFKKTTLVIGLILFSTSAFADKCVTAKQRTTPEGYVLTAAKCIGAMEQYGELAGQDNSFFGSAKWLENAAFIDKTCGYGDGSMTVEEEAGFAKTNFTGFVINKNMGEARAVLSGCENLIDNFMQ